MVARTWPAALDHNANTRRDHATASWVQNKGERRFKVVFPKRSEEWIANPIMENMLDAIVERMCQGAAE